MTTENHITEDVTQADNQHKQLKHSVSFCLSMFGLSCFNVILSGTQRGNETANFIKLKRSGKIKFLYRPADLIFLCSDYWASYFKERISCSPSKLIPNVDHAPLQCARCDLNQPTGLVSVQNVESISHQRAYQHDCSIKKACEKQISSQRKNK